MQNDIKLPKEQRRNYKNAFDGVIQIYRTEGFKQLFNGCSMAVLRAIFMTIGQLSFYDQIKQTVVDNGYSDNIYTHLFSSCSAASMATVLTQPIDVMKTRMMNAKPGMFFHILFYFKVKFFNIFKNLLFNVMGMLLGEYKNIMHCFVLTGKQGPTAFFKGFVPAFVRLAPHTVLMFVFFEQLRQRFGYLPVENKTKSV